jgi:hypothetical protein
MYMSFARPLALWVRSAIPRGCPSLVGLPIAALAALTGCSDPVAPPAQTGWTVNFQRTSVGCEIASHTMKVGDVNEKDRTKVIVDGKGGADISCTVKGSSSFAVTDTSALYQGRVLAMEIPSITKNAKQATPAKGVVAYASEITVDTYQPNMTPCDFFFMDGTGEGVAAGKIWVAFNCPEVIGEMSTCAMSGAALFENCSTE